jgi:hypothetical protein
MRRYADPVEVRSHDAEPVGFRWRGRVYLVRDVLARWIERGSWWTATTGSRTPATAGTAAPSVAHAVGAVEHEVWRVEAAAGSVVGVYDLVRDLLIIDEQPSEGADPDFRSDAHARSDQHAHPDQHAHSDPHGAGSRWRLVRSLD